MPEIETKYLVTGAQLKADEDEGHIEAVFSTFGVVDRDGDLVEPGAIPDGQDVPMVWAHDWTRIIGRGITAVDSERAVFKGRLFLDTEAGREAYATIKSMGDLMQYSWGFRVIDADFAERDENIIRVIKRAELFEVSPVLVGAGIDTGTVLVKHGQPFVDHAAAVQAAVADFVARSRSLADLRRKEGRVLSAANRERLSTIAGSLTQAAQELNAILTETEPKSADVDVNKLWTAFLANEARVNGVMVP